MITDFKIFENQYTKSSHTTYQVSKSRIDLSKEVAIKSWINCPVCNYSIDDMVHGEIQKCKKCKNTFQVSGNSLQTTNKRPWSKSRQTREKKLLDLTEVDYSDPKRIKEILHLSDYEKGKKLVCPFCKKEIRKIQHGETKDCPKCGLEMTVYGNALYCTLDAKKVEFAETTNKYNL